LGQRRRGEERQLRPREVGGRRLLEKGGRERQREFLQRKEGEAVEKDGEIQKQEERVSSWERIGEFGREDW